MCMEDINIGRMSRSAELQITHTALDLAIIGPDPNRTSLIFSAPLTDAVWLTTDGVAFVGKGLIVRSTDPPLLLDIFHHGQMVVKCWRGISTAGVPVQSVFTNSLPYGNINPAKP